MGKLIDVILTGEYSAINLTFFSGLLAGAQEVRFNTPTVPSYNDPNKIIEIFNSYDYVDFVVSTNRLMILEKNVQNVFINIGKNEGKLELLFFFDLYDIDVSTDEDRISYLKRWTQSFKLKYSFNYFLCRLEESDEKDYLFDSDDLGPLFRY